jgi:membrane associated rhomboid family serine protease
MSRVERQFMGRVWKPAMAFLIVTVVAGLLLGLTSLDAVQGALAALVLAVAAAIIVASVQRRPQRPRS